MACCFQCARWLVDRRRDWLGDRERRAEGGDGSRVVDSLYGKLEQIVIPLFYNDRNRFLQIMAHAIALNGSFFNTHRMMQQYVLKAYF
jgi:starch phosphorylase